MMCLVKVKEALHSRCATGASRSACEVLSVQPPGQDQALSSDSNKCGMFQMKNEEHMLAMNSGRITIAQPDIIRMFNTPV